MELHSTFISKWGQPIEVTSKSIESELDIKDVKVGSVRAFCFYHDQLVIVFSKDHWGLPGGGVEKDEDLQSAIKREIKEETNMNVLHHRFISLEKFLEVGKEARYQALSVCFVEPFGDFVADPDEDITEIKFIDPQEYKKYFDYGERGDRLLERALEVKKQMDKK